MFGPTMTRIDRGAYILGVFSLLSALVCFVLVGATATQGRALLAVTFLLNGAALAGNGIVLFCLARFTAPKASANVLTIEIKETR